MQALRNIQLEFGVSPAQAKILLFLAAKRAVTAEMLVTAKVATQPKIAINRLRVRLQEKEHPFEITHQRGVGWSVSDEDRAQIAAVAKQADVPADSELAGIVDRMGSGDGRETNG